jgi:hypothetical protein
MDYEQALKEEIVRLDKENNALKAENEGLKDCLLTRDYAIKEYKAENIALKADNKSYKKINEYLKEENRRLEAGKGGEELSPPIKPKEYCTCEDPHEISGVGLDGKIQTICDCGKPIKTEKIETIRIDNAIREYLQQYDPRKLMIWDKLNEVIDHINKKGV